MAFYSHHPGRRLAHYGGALRGYSKADVELQTSIIDGRAIDPNAYGAIQRSRSSKGNSVLLHELYFDGLAPKAADPGSGMRLAIEKRFGSIEKWSADFQASAKAAAGHESCRLAGSRPQIQSYQRIRH